MHWHYLGKPIKYQAEQKIHRIDLVLHANISPHPPSNILNPTPMQRRIKLQIMLDGFVYT